MVPIKMLYIQDVVGDRITLPGDESQGDQQQDLEEADESDEPP